MTNLLKHLFVFAEFDSLIDIIRRDELNVRTEENIFEACMRWIKWEESRAPLLPQVLSKVRLPLLTPQFLADRVATEDLIRSSHQCRDLLDEAKDFHLMPERRALVQSFRTRPRCYDYVIGQIFAVGGLTKNGESVSTVEIFDPLTREWKMGEAMSMLRSRVGVAVSDGKLYAFGGFNGCERLSTVRKWRDFRFYSKSISRYKCVLLLLILGGNIRPKNQSMVTRTSYAVLSKCRWCCGIG